MADKQLRLVLLGDATSVQKALKSLDAELSQTDTAVKKTGQNLAQNEAKVESFGKQFAKLGLAVGAVALLKQAQDAVEAFTAKMQDSEATILGVTHSQTALGQAYAFADQQQKAGLSAYSDTVAAIAQLTPVAQRAKLDVTDLYHTVQLLSTLNSGPEGGVEGSVIAINEALAGQYTSLQRRFNLPINGIRDAVNAGVPALQAINDALAKEGITMDLVAAKAATNANQHKIFFDSLTRIAAELEKPFFAKSTSELILWNKALNSSGMKQFTAELQDLIATITTGNYFAAWSVEARQAFYLVGNAYNDMIKAVSGGKFNIDGPLAAMRAGIVADEAKVRAAVQQGVAKPVADELSGAASGSPLAPEKVVGYGQALANSYLKGLSSADLDEVDKLTSLLGDLFKGADGKQDADQLARAQVILAQALKEVASQGGLTDDTMRDLSAAFGLQAPDVYNLITAYTRYQQALSGVALAQVKVQGAQAGVSIVTAQAAGETKQLQDNLDAATASAQANADASAAVVAGLQDTLKGVQETADEAARAGQKQLEGLQGDLEALQSAASQHAAARQAEIAAAQAQVSAASQQRSNDQALLNAALAGELEYEEQILDGLTDQQRARAAVWQTEIDGQRRAKEGADQKVTDLGRAAHKEDLDYLTKIDAARSSGNEKEARRLERELAARQKQRQAATQLAQAQAAVANDQFDAAQEQVKKEGKDQEVKDTQAERAAQANLTRIQAAADAQKAADDAAIAAKNDQIKKVQEAQKAEQERYAAQERGIQTEIDKTTEAAKVQAAKDKKTIDDARTILDDRKKFWDQEVTKATEGATQAGNQAKSAQNFADQMKIAYDYVEKIAKIDLSNITNAATAAAKLPGGGGTPPGATNPAIMPGGYSPYDEPSPAVAASRWLADNGARGWGPPILGGSPPPGFHSETRPTGVWWVKDGSTLNAAGTAIGPANPPSAPTNGQPNSGGGGGPGELNPEIGAPLSRVGGFGDTFLRASGVGGQGNDGGGTTIVINAPNLRDIRDKRDLADLGAHLERTWKDIARGGRTKGEVA